MIPSSSTRELLHAHDQKITYLKEMLIELRNHRAVRGKPEVEVAAYYLSSCPLD